MQLFGIGKREMEMARLLWEKKELRSSEVVILCKEKLGWAKSTTFTMLRRICQHGLFQNIDSVVTPVMSEEEYLAKVCKAFVDDKFDGSIAELVGLVFNNQKISEDDREKLREMVQKK